MSKVASNLPEAPKGFRWVTRSRQVRLDPETGEYVPDSNGDWMFLAKEDGKYVVEVKGHVCYLIPTTNAAAESVFADEPKRTFFDPVAKEQFTVSGIQSAAAKITGHKSESARGQARQHGAKHGTVTDLDQVQGWYLGEDVTKAVMKARLDAAEDKEEVLAILKEFGLGL